MIDHAELAAIIALSGLSLEEIALLGRLKAAQGAFREASSNEQGYISVTSFDGFRWGALNFRRHESGGADGEIRFSTLAEAVERAERLVADLRAGRLS